mgnify:CR=1 FL=1
MNSYSASKKNFLTIFCISLLLFSTKWVLSFLYFNNEDLTIKIINDSIADSHTYFHYIKSLANLDFNALYNTELSTIYYLPIPYGSVIFHTIFYKLFGDLSFILLELIGVFLFILIFFSIFRLLSFSTVTSILISTSLYILPEALLSFKYFGIVELKSFAENFYNLRFPRPFVANLLFFAFLYILIKIHLSKTLFNIKNLFSLSIIFALSFSSFFFLFLNQIVTFILYLIVFYKQEIFTELKKKYLKIFYPSLLFIFITTPFIFIIFNANPDYIERMGVIEISSSDKVFLIKHYISKIFRLKLLAVYALLIFSYFFMKKFNKDNLKYIYIFYILFISSLITPIVFILLSKKIAFLYHFNNTVVICVVLLFLVLTLININFLLNKIGIKIKNIYFFTFIFFLILFFHNFNEYKKFKNNDLRVEKNEIINLIITNKLVDFNTAKILTFDRSFMTWSILKGNKNLLVVDGTYTSRDSSIIENDLINAFKFFKLKEEDFKNFISNKKIGYRYNNPILKSFFWQKYTANSFHRYNKSNDFDKEVLDFILSSSPYYAHQFAIPNYELKRLQNKFKLNDLDKSFNPDIIINNKNYLLFNNIDIDNNEYCKKYVGNKLDLYLLKKFCD